ncbi:MAG: hypothetical protein ACOX8U_11300 [Bradymonadia bacterium]|jgi:DNA-binding NarL/FixJ family response regulator
MSFSVSKEDFLSMRKELIAAIKENRELRSELSALKPRAGMVQNEPSSPPPECIALFNWHLRDLIRQEALAKKYGYKVRRTSSEKLRKVFELHFEGLSAYRIAKVLGIEHDTVKTAIEKLERDHPS